MVKGFDSWNVPLYKSLNSKPSSTHRSGLKEVKASAVTKIYALSESDFVLTTSEDAAVNIWSTKAGLTPISSFNFKLQFNLDPKDTMSRAQLYFLNFEAREIQGGVVIYSKKGN
jgi:hypothetical protein